MRIAVLLFVVGASMSMVRSVPVRASANVSRASSPRFEGGTPSTQETPHGVTTNRRVIDLNGTWQVAEGAMDSIPKQFEHTVPVPGLIDMAKPAFAEVGKKSDRRQAFWYRRTFTVEGSIPAGAAV